jgi:hypothetical protein
MLEGFHEDDTIHKVSNRVCPEMVRCRTQGYRDPPNARDFGCHLIITGRPETAHISTSVLKRLKEMEAELSQLKRIYADLQWRTGNEEPHK